MRGRTLSLSKAEARRLAVRAQGLGANGLPTRVERRTLRSVFARIGVVQIDSVNVLVRSQYLPLFSRVGPYRRKLLDELAYGPRRALFEYWGHEASLIPLELFPLFRWRMARAERFEGTWSGLARWARNKRDFIESIYRQIEQRGPTGAGELEKRNRPGSWWGWTDAKAALEYLFWAGRVSTAYRRSFERVYDTTERVIPAAILQLPHLQEAEAHRQLLRLSLKAMGFGTERQLRDYFRLPTPDAKRRIAELVEAEEFLPVTVDGIQAIGYVLRGTPVPRRSGGAALLSPFDSLVWERDRTEHLFDFHYRIEIYTPAHKRVHGYYVLPFLLGDRLVARVDLRADREHSALELKALHLEPRVRRADVLEALYPQLERMREWLGLERRTGLRRARAKSSMP
ncbi:MAG: YcaQ family DNA glycosylase [Candidatus Eremiobacteraeota bacterium]|nr:YcaQ family DNA glycosylase [Candidatus Eremiobacteraeota bacterium]